MKGSYRRLTFQAIFELSIFCFLFFSSSLAYPISIGSCSTLFSKFGELSDEVVEVTEIVWGQEIHYFRLSKDLLRKGKLQSSKLNSENAVFIGIEPRGHVYIVAGNYRYDGDFITHDPKLKKVNLLSEGVVVKLKDSDGSLRNNFETYFNQNGAPRSLNCVSGACKVIRRSSDLSIDSKSLKVYLPQSFLKRVIQQGFQDSQGNSIDSTVFVLGDKELKNIDEEIGKRSRTEVYKFFLGYGLLFGAPASLSLFEDF